MQNRRKAERRAEKTEADIAREVEIMWEEIMDLNNNYGTRFDVYIQPQIVNTLQDLEDFVGTMYNNYNANVKAKGKTYV